MIHADAALARRLEGFICREWRQLADIAATLWPEKDVATMEVGGGVALWLGDGGLVNVAAGMAMEGPIGETELRRVEDFYVRWGAPPMLATCPFADPTLFAVLGRRGWQLTEFENVLAMELPSAAEGMVGLAAKLPPQIDLRVCATPAERAVFGRVAARGFSDETAPGSAHVEFGDMMAAHEASILALAWVDGQPAGTGALKIEDGIAWLSADSTIPLFRRRGIQQALQRFRLQLAWAAGCRLAIIEAAVGSASQRNMERLGFRVIYPHLHFAKV
jgi:GNAT superfamily N-acetyltransferase